MYGVFYCCIRQEINRVVCYRVRLETNAYTSANIESEYRERKINKILTSINSVQVTSLRSVLNGT